MGQAVHSARCMALAEELHRALAAEGIPALLLKGPVMAQQAWVNPALRHYDDLDIRCPRLPYPVLAAILQRHGLRPELPDTNRQLARWRFGWGVAFAAEDGILVECNWRMFPPHFPWPRKLDRDRMLHAEPCRLDHGSVVGPTPGFHLLYGCLHALWHGWDRLAWLVDIAGLLVCHPESLAQARVLAGSHGFLRQVLNTGCELSDSLLGPLPSVHHLDVSTLPAQQAAFCYDAHPNRLVTVRNEQSRYMNRTERLRYTFQRCLTPGDPDFQRWRLPAGLHGMYWFLRLARIATRPVRPRPRPATGSDPSAGSR
jgi:hypothetical protein